MQAYKQLQRFFNVKFIRNEKCKYQNYKYLLIKKITI